MIINERTLKEIASGHSHHLQFNADHWKVSKFREDDLKLNPRDILREMEKVEEEGIKPIQMFETNNIIVTAGMNESIDRDLGVSSTNLDYNSLGTSGTAESASQTDLVAEDSGGSYARKRFSTEGGRTRVNQTAKYAMLWSENDISGTPLTIKEFGVHWHLSDASKMHARVVITPFTVDPGDFLVVQINELHENGTL
jgi:hypothetical protein